MKLATVAVAVFFVVVAVGSVMAMAFLEEADDAGADVWADACPDEVER